ncbi:MAG: type II toxin-antitoxin system Phd/YefM family antitoxin [Proteobacteria bacterium]|nr:type II toxin-antitoxin system Phd/YefM family antitoxin [Pseudomonadota bacterium]
MKKTIDAVTARKQFGRLLDEVYYKGDFIVIERNGKPMATLIPNDMANIRKNLFDKIDEIAREHRDANREVDSEEIDACVLNAVNEIRRGK